VASEHGVAIKNFSSLELEKKDLRKSWETLRKKVIVLYQNIFFRKRVILAQ